MSPKEAAALAAGADMDQNDDSGEWDSPEPIIIPDSTVPDRSPEEAALACFVWVQAREQQKPKP